MKRRRYSTIVFLAIFLISSLLVIANTSKADAATYNYTITADSEYINKYTPARNVCGYVKDLNGRPIANATVYASYYPDWTNIPKNAEPIYKNYTTVKTDSKGYYCFLGRTMGYYAVFLSTEGGSPRDFAYVYIS